eukprot:TRINITY_DN10628_c0_g1_i12.p1 TRINITY_DN10628_c0_g1~~TRINITY_DN10628_c0_g1_i12.p1  ORF type:complete len:387 (-),score=69.14 TRINITY_DN10628_c0_g1_i12:375-1535(-)
MDRFKIIKEVGDGTFGSVWQAINKQTGEIVAIKKLKRKYYSWEDCMNLREVKSLFKMNHPNIVELKEDFNLYQIIKDKGKLFSEIEVRNWCYQVFQALAYMHQRGYFHRDLKPENLLVTKNIIKIADFGLAREVCSQPPYTEYVSTRWYRAPEVLLQSSIYGSAVDMWAMGAIMAEMFTLRPLFPGSSEADEICKICSVIGRPTQSSWAEGLQLARAIKYEFPQVSRLHLSVLIPSASKDAISLISSLCSWDPCKRPTAAETLQHSFFQPCFYVPPSLRLRAAAPRTPHAGVEGALGQTCSKRYSATLSKAKPASNLCPVKISTLGGGVQRKLEMDGQCCAKQPRYRLPARSNHTGLNKASDRVSDVAETMAHMTVGARRQQQGHL